ncbi:MAG: Ig-like domain-containing protein, partial [Cytophagales bacterium]|nr:Ig-like domain-containing protein [Cytophagales bacterium]
MRLLPLIVLLWGMLADAAPVTAARPDPVAPARAAFAPPAHTGLTPASNATGVAPGTSLRIGFDQPVTKGTGAVRVYRPDGTERFAAVDVGTDAVTLSATGQEAVIALPAALLPGETVYVNVDAGTFVNATAEPFAGIAGTEAWRFTANAAPALTGTNPANGATDVGLTDPLTAAFDENILKGTGSLHLFYNGAD